LKRLTISGQVAADWRRLMIAYCSALRGHPLPGCDQ